jgi:Family of unknown function (DUF5677)
MRMSRKDRAAELKKIRAYVENAEREVSHLGIVPRAAYKFPFDIVALATLSKAFAIAKACLKLLASDCPDEAYGLSRSLVECATNLRYLTAVPTERDKRSHDFVKFALADKAFWYHHTLEVAKSANEKAKLRAYAKQMGVADNPKLARQHWSGQGGGFVWTTSLLNHALDGAATVDHRKKAYAVDYYLTSAFVHCSLLAIDNYFIEDGVPFYLSTSSGHHETYQSTLFTILIHIHEAMGYVLYGLNIDRPARLDSLFQRTLKKMRRIPTRYKKG